MIDPLWIFFKQKWTTNYDTKEEHLPLRKQNRKWHYSPCSLTSITVETQKRKNPTDVGGKEGEKGKW